MRTIGILTKTNLIYFYRKDFLIFGDLIGDAFKTMADCVHRRYSKFSIFSEIQLMCFLIKRISYNFLRLAMLYLKHLITRCFHDQQRRLRWSFLRK